MEQTNKPSFPTLYTERLMLRQLNLSDATDLFALRSNVEIGKYIDRELPKKNEEIIDFINQRIKEGKNNESFYWAIILKSENKLIGTICLWNHSKENNKIEIGYELNPIFQNNGYMDEALKAIIKYAFEVLKVNIIEAYTHAENISSIKLLEKNNFTFQDKFNEEYRTKDGVFEMAVFELKKLEIRN